MSKFIKASLPIFASSARRLILDIRRLSRRRYLLTTFCRTWCASRTCTAFTAYNPVIKNLNMDTIKRKMFLCRALWLGLRQEKQHKRWNLRVNFKILANNKLDDSKKNKDEEMHLLIPISHSSTRGDKSQLRSSSLRSLNFCLFD